MALVWLKQILGTNYTDEIDKLISEKIGEGFIARADFNARTEELRLAKEQLAQRDADVATMKKDAGENEELKKQLSDLQTKYKSEGDAAATALAQHRLTAAIEMALLSAGARSVKATKALLDMEKIKLDGEQLMGLSEQLEALRKDQGFLFTAGGEGSQQRGYDYQPRGGDDPRQETPSTLQSVIATEMAARIEKPL